MTKINETGATVNMAEYVIDVTNMDGIPFRVVYGHRTYRDGTKSLTPVVTFYDRRYAHTAHGQFVSDYTLDTMLERRAGYGLCLDGGVSNWNVDATTMVVVTSWLKQMAFQLKF